MPAKAKSGGGQKKKAYGSKKNVRGTMKRRITADKGKKKDFVRASSKKLTPWEKGGARIKKNNDALPTDPALLKKYEDKIPKSMRRFMQWMNSDAKREMDERDAAAAGKPAPTTSTSVLIDDADEKAEQKKKQKKLRRSKHLPPVASTPTPTPTPTPTEVVTKKPDRINHARSLMDLVAEANTSSEVLVPDGIVSSAGNNVPHSTYSRGSFTTMQRKRKATSSGKANKKRKTVEDDDMEDMEILTDDEAQINLAEDNAPVVDSHDVTKPLDDHQEKVNATGIHDWSQLNANKPRFGEQAQAPPTLAAPKEKRSLMPDHIKRKSLQEMMTRLAEGGPAEVHDKVIKEAGSRRSEGEDNFLAMQQAARDQYAAFKKRDYQKKQAELKAAQAKPKTRSAKRKANATDHSREVRDFAG